VGVGENESEKIKKIEKVGAAQKFSQKSGKRYSPWLLPAWQTLH
jgi:hypothetical protein